jgi:hypothetical protein
MSEEFSRLINRLAHCEAHLAECERMIRDAKFWGERVAVAKAEMERLLRERYWLSQQIERHALLEATPIQNQPQ